MLESIEEYNANISKCVTDDQIGSKLVVAVMTVCGHLGTPINLLKIFDLYTNGKIDPRFKLNFVPNSKKSKEKKDKAFYNCLSVLFYIKDELDIESKIAAKVFPNGSIQLAGCRTIYAVHKAPKVLCEFIRTFKKIDNQFTKILKHRSAVFGKCKKFKEDFEKREVIIKNHKDFELNNVRISMINSNFVFQTTNENGDFEQAGIVQERLKHVVNNNKYDGKGTKGRYWRMATYQPEKYAGVNIRYWTEEARKKYAIYYLEGRKLPKKIDGQISIFIFRSGKGTITAAKSSKDLLEAYQEICNLVRENSITLFHKNSRDPNVEKPLTVVSYPLEGLEITVFEIDFIHRGSRVQCTKEFFDRAKLGNVIKISEIETVGENTFFTFDSKY